MTQQINQAITYLVSATASIIAVFVLGVYLRIVVGAFCLGFGCK